MKEIKFSGPQDEVNLNFRALPTPMVSWKGTAKELHNIIIKAWVESEPVAATDEEK